MIVPAFSISAFAGKVSRHRAQRDAARSRRLSHPNAPVAPRLVGARTRRDEFREVTIIGQRLQNVTRTRINVEGNAIVHFMAPHDSGRDGEVPEAGIGGRADVG